MEDLTASNLWFLSFKRSVEKKDANVYLSLDAKRGVQPVPLEPYYLALRAGNGRSAMPQLLKSKDTGVVERALTFICGGDLPWPYGPIECEALHPPCKGLGKLREHAAAVENLLLGTKDPESRHLAASIYA